MPRISLLLILTCLLLGPPVARAAEPASAGKTFRDCPTCPEMVVIPPGVFVMGTADPGPAEAASAAERQATVVRIPQAFALGRTEVTRGEFAEFIHDSGYEIRPPGCRTWDASQARFSDGGRRTWVDPGVPAAPTDAYPVSCVSWSDAQAYVQWLSRKTHEDYRLPSEAEWEYAARGGSATLRYWGDAPQDGCDYANTYDVTSRDAYRLGWPNAGCADGYADVAPVGQFRPNAYGLYDMIGNVWEWTQDCATDSYVGRPTDGSAWTWLGGCDRHVMRGGGWLSPPSRSRSAYRGEAPTSERADFLGFRVARELGKPTRTESRR